ncbi:hypothetical protein K3495_g7988 [Podosphaera aphanis]|nr:hypothetical protein K3495_g7988 [Podosphaera aphanis]
MAEGQNIESALLAEDKSSGEAPKTSEAKQQPEIERNRMGATSRQKRKRAPPTDADLDAELLAHFHRLCLWEYFIYASHQGKDRLIKEVFGERFAVDSTKYKELRQSAMDKVKNFKARTLEYAEVFVHQELRNTPALEKGTRSLWVAYFKGRFSAKSFLSVWHVMKGLLDVDKSHALGIWFMKSIFSEVLAETIEFVLACKNLGVGADGRMRRDENARKKFVAAYTGIFMAPAFNNVAKRHFYELQETSRGQKKVKVPPDLTVLERLELDAPPEA